MKRIVMCLALFGSLILNVPVTAQEEAEAPEAPWKQRFHLNASGSAGNTRSFDMRTGWRARQSTELIRRRADASYLYGETEGERHQSAFTAGYVQDWLMPEAPWFVFAQSRYDFDNYRSWRHRLSGHVGLGKELIDTEELQLLGRVGGGLSKQWERTEDLRSEGLIGAELTWDMSEQQHFFASSYYYPDLGDLSEGRVVSTAELNVAIDRARGVDLVCGVEHEYETSAGTEARNWDFRYYAGISIAF